MAEISKYTFAIAKRPKDKKEVLRHRFKHAKASLAIEGLHLTAEEINVFEECIQKECNFEERAKILKERFHNYAY